ncbi:MAG TPA: gamma-glutamyltransferase family protein [Rhizomicrobium sp.]
MGCLLLAALLAVTPVSAVQAKPKEPALGHAMVAAANPLAVQAGLAVLRRGGNAVDAAVAVQAMLGLVEPQSSGVGGGAIIMVHDAARGTNLAFIGREKAPAGATLDMFMGPGAKPLPHREAMLTGRATGVPGAIAALWKAHSAAGRLPWNELFGDAIRTAREGFKISPRLQEHIDGKFPQAQAPDVKRYFSRPDGTPMRTGDLLRNPAYAETLALISEKGPDAILTGRIANDIAARTHDAPLPGTMTLQDLSSYQAEETPALCRPYRIYVICGAPPPASGVGLLELMGILERTDIGKLGPNDPQAWYLFAEASRLMYADRDHYVGDPNYVSVPVQGLLNSAYLAHRRALLGEHAAAQVSPGTPPNAPATGSDATNPPGGTSQLVVIDAQGNVVSMTTTVESFFGSGRMVDGFFLNNQLTDFSSDPLDNGLPAANAVAGGKRPRSSMTPVLVFNKYGQFYGAIGSPGGTSIPAYVGKSLVGILDWNLSVQSAVDLPNLIARDPNIEGEVSRFSPDIVKGLAEKGIVLKQESGESSGLHGIFVKNGQLEGGADSRREGAALQP